MDKTIYYLLCIFATLAVGCSGGNDGGDIGGSGTNPNMGVNNLLDQVATGAVQEVGMTYAEVKGYVNGCDTPNELSILNNGYFIGVEYGTSEHSLNSISNVSSAVLDKRTLNIIIRDLKPNTKYYYRMRWSGNDIYYTGKEVNSFTTKDVIFNGQMSTGDAKDVTFLHATINAQVNTATISNKETFHKGIVYSQDISKLSIPLVDKLRQAKKVHENNGEIELVQEGGSTITSYWGHYQNGDIHFQMSNDDNDLSLSMEPGTTFYYCPLLVIGDKSFTGDVKQVTTRDLSVKSGYVDLGLSCLWSATNIDASSPWEMGSSYTSISSASSAVSARSNGGRLPTLSEVQELNKCKIEHIDNGVLITGPNGKQIFLSTRELTSNTTSISIVPNYYWTSSTTWETVLGSTTDYNCCYYVGNNKIESYDRPILSYPYNMNMAGCYLRAVKDGGSSTGGGNGDGIPQTIDDIVGTYTAYDAYYNAAEQKWIYYADYQITITAQYSGSQYLYVTNFFDAGKTIEGYFDKDKGYIVLFSGQSVLTTSQGDFKLMSYDSESNSYVFNDLTFTYYTDYGYYKSAIYGLIENQYGYCPYITYMKKNSSSVSARPLQQSICPQNVKAPERINHKRNR